MEDEHILQTQLEKYCRNGLYPMHMPGHKRNLPPAPGLPYDWDLTEVEGVDDLHHAEGILREAMNRTSALWRSRRSWYVVNGSTCGILASISAAVPHGGEIILARNCHKSVFHAVELLDLQPHWLMPDLVPDWNLAGSILPDSVRMLLKRYPSSRAVVVTSPTYEGVVSDIRAIAEICHKKGVPLIVDEAHGAHFGLFQEGRFPESSLHLGADLVIQSAHKTLPSMTQTAFLHLGKDSMVSEEAVEHALDLFETSSPSYPLMASLDGCTGILANRGRELFAEWRREILKTNEIFSSLKTLERFIPEDRDEVWDYDDSRFLVRAKPETGTTGDQLAGLFREKGRIESEMHCGRNVLFMTGCGDSEEGFRAFRKALVRVDDFLSTKFLVTQAQRPDKMSVNRNEAVSYANRNNGVGEESDLQKESGTESRNSTIEKPLPSIETVYRISEVEWIARAGKVVDFPVSEAAGRISAAYVMAYPPGIPILIPGERITDEAIRVILYLCAQNSNMVGVASRENGDFDLKVLESL